VVIGTDHGSKNQEFKNGYTFEADDGTTVSYTGPAIRISEPYRDHDAFVTDLSIFDWEVTMTRHLM